MFSSFLWHAVRRRHDGKPRLGFGDDRLVVVGETLHVDPPIHVGQRGLHACCTLEALARMDLLSIQNPHYICLVSLRGETAAYKGSSVLAGEYRTVHSMIPPSKCEKFCKHVCKTAAYFLGEVVGSRIQAEDTRDLFTDAWLAYDRATNRDDKGMMEYMGALSAIREMQHRYSGELRSELYYDCVSAAIDGNVLLFVACCNRLEKSLDLTAKALIKTVYKRMNQSGMEFVMQHSLPYGSSDESSIG